MDRRYVLPVIAFLACVALLVACGGSTATDTPKAAIPTTAAASAATTAPTTAPTAAGSASAAAATRPASSTATGSTTAPTTSAGSSAVASRPAGSATTGSAPTSSTTAAGSTTAGAGLTLVTDPKGRFSFSRPSAWTVSPPTSSLSVVAFTTSQPSGSIDISTESVSGSLTQYLDASLAAIKKNIPDAQQVGTTDLQLDTESAVQIDYTGTVNGAKIYFSQIFALHNGTAYILTLGTQPANINAMKQQAIVVVRTWKFLQ